ncbi:hypothetical protein AYJ57_18975 [Salipiger sp. CCB-MM3]|uniref:BCCT family transporter n=1 Tax=Salipiger sp. CCB-MM3 TaxID=1792508 RepID=UPI00080AAF83|nr:BCCT family transporter [Salipiger sp. CCB-MM3]ANT62477.1 hypothetical protein AYJ57_18975 [Salipiger sp. CCB-MM3]
MTIELPPSQIRVRTVAGGFYRGFNPVVSLSAKLLITLGTLFLLLAPEVSTTVLEALKRLTLTRFAGWYVYIMGGFVVFNLVLVCLPISGRITLGIPGVKPEHGTLSWLSMMFCAGIGIGILVFSVSEPVSNFLSNPDILAGDISAGSAETVPSAMRFVFLHWGLSAWSCYVVIGLALGLACHRSGHPMTIRSALAALLGRRLEGALGHGIDIVSILAIAAGITTTIVLGLEQICSGLSILTGSAFFADSVGNPPLVALLSALVLTIAVTIASVVSGVERGVKWMSNAGIVLAFVVLVVFIFCGGRDGVAVVFAQSVTAYVTALPGQIFTLYGDGSELGAAQRGWQSDWTIFYWAWWIAFAPFVGVFLARISRGRSVRQFICGAMLGPTVMCFIWFSATGGSALLMELGGRGGGRILEAEHAFRVFAAIDVMLPGPGGVAVKALLALLLLVLVVSSATAAIIAIKSIGAGGSELAETPMHSILWAVLIATATGAVIAVGGVGSIRDLMVVGAVPFSFILVAMLLSVIRQLAGEARRGR